MTLAIALHRHSFDAMTPRRGTRLNVVDEEHDTVGAADRPIGLDALADAVVETPQRPTRLEPHDDRRSNRARRAAALEGLAVGEGAIGEQRLTELRAGSVRSDPVCVGQLGSEQRRIREICPTEIGPGEVDRAEVRSDQCGVLENRATQIGVGEIRPGEICTGEITGLETHRGEVLVLTHRVRRDGAVAEPVRDCPGRTPAAGHDQHGNRYDGSQPESTHSSTVASRG